MLDFLWNLLGSNDGIDSAVIRSSLRRCIEQRGRVGERKEGREGGREGETEKEEGSREIVRMRGRERQRCREVARIRFCLNVCDITLFIHCRYHYLNVCNVALFLVSIHCIGFFPHSVVQIL